MEWLVLLGQDSGLDIMESDYDLQGGMGGPRAHSSRCPLPLLVYPKPGQAGIRFRDAPGQECSVGLGLGIPKMESSALCPEARLMPARTL